MTIHSLDTKYLFRNLMSRVSARNYLNDFPVFFSSRHPQHFWQALIKYIFFRIFCNKNLCIYIRFVICGWDKTNKNIPKNHSHSHSHSQLSNLPFDLAMRKIMLHNLLQHHNFIILDLIFLLLLNCNLLILHTTSLLPFFLLQSKIVSIIVIYFYHLNLLFCYQTNPVVDIFVDFGLGEYVVLASFYLLLDLFVFYDISF